ncbi:hypothetical protein [Dulcicalothrix desertica]|nr:hypothetical protein [Dulcicalothrix desertica]
MSKTARRQTIGSNVNRYLVYLELFLRRQILKNCYKKSQGKEDLGRRKVS